MEYRENVTAGWQLGKGLKASKTSHESCENNSWLIWKQRFVQDDSPTRLWNSSRVWQPQKFLDGPCRDAAENKNNKIKSRRKKERTSNSFKSLFLVVAVKYRRKLKSKLWFFNSLYVLLRNTLTLLQTEAEIYLISYYFTTNCKIVKTAKHFSTNLFILE